MNQQQLFTMLPDLQPEELSLIQSLTQDMSEGQQQQFFHLYRGKRKEPQTLLILAAIGFFGVAGIQRFVTGEPVLGLLFLFTWGFCGIGTLIDMINHKSLAGNYNQAQAVEAAQMARMMQR